MKRFSWLRTVLIAFALTVMMAAPSFAVETLTGTLTYGGQSYTVTGYWKSNAKQTKVKFVTSSVVKKGWLQLGGYTYYLKGKGKRVTGVVYIGGRYYYFDNEGKQRTGLINTGDATYYFDPAEHGARAVGAGERVIDGNTYVFNALGQVLINAFDDSGNFYDAKGQRIHKATIKRLIQVALQPVGSTMYVWGGGWNQTDDGSGIESTTIGVPSRWAIFFRSQTKDYEAACRILESLRQTKDEPAKRSKTLQSEVKSLLDSYNETMNMVNQYAGGSMFYPFYPDQF